MFSMLFIIIYLYPCWTDKDSKDLAYVRKVIEFIDSNPTMFNNQKIYIQGEVTIPNFAFFTSREAAGHVMV